MKTYFYDVTLENGIVLKQAVLIYNDEFDQYSLVIDRDTSTEVIDVHPEEVADIYTGKFGDYLKERIRAVMST